MPRLCQTDGLSEDQTEILKAVRQFVDERIIPVAQELEHADEYPTEIIEGLKELGVFGLTIPEEFGGLGESLLTYALVVEEIARQSVEKARADKGDLRRRSGGPLQAMRAADDQQDPRRAGAAECGKIDLDRLSGRSDCGGMREGLGFRARGRCRFDEGRPSHTIGIEKALLGRGQHRKETNLAHRPAGEPAENHLIRNQILNMNKKNKWNDGAARCRDGGREPKETVRCD